MFGHRIYGGAGRFLKLVPCETAALQGLVVLHNAQSKYSTGTANRYQAKRLGKSLAEFLDRVCRKDKALPLTRAALSRAAGSGPRAGPVAKPKHRLANESTGRRGRAARL